jgi:hypothetical protein
MSKCLNEESFPQLVNVLLLTGHDEVAKVLCDNIKKLDISDLIDLSRCDPRNKEIGNFNFYKDSSKDVIIKVECNDSHSLTYDMKNKPRGVCLLINNFFTVGTYKEIQRFRNIFYNLHFDVIMKKI